MVHEREGQRELEGSGFSRPSSSRPASWTQGRLRAFQEQLKWQYVLFFILVGVEDKDVTRVEHAGKFA
jgi:hypothetical protein